MSSLDRRSFLQATLAGSLAFTLSNVVRPLAGWAGEVAVIDFDSISGLSPLVTHNEAFYRISKNLFDPRVDGSKWSLRIDGEVSSPLVLTEEQIREMPSVELYLTLECISNEVGGDLIGNALWRGVRLRDLLQQAGVSDGVTKARFDCADNYSTGIPIDKAMDPDTLLAYDMNGVPLPPEHGYPLRLINPGHYGTKNPKWIERIRLVSDDYLGYWEQRGWSDAAVVKTMSRIDVPRAGVVRTEKARWIAGIALAGTRGIDSVAVSMNDGRSWRQAALEDPLSNYTWRRWALLWKSSKSGNRVLVARATDGTGTPQIEQTSPPLPDGASGLHRIKIRSR